MIERDEVRIGRKYLLSKQQYFNKYFIKEQVLLAKTIRYFKHKYKPTIA